MIELWNNLIAEDEINAMVEAVRNKQISEGKIVKKFEEKLIRILETKYAMVTPNGTSALTLALMGAGIKPGDEVIVPNITFIATANAAKILGAKVIVADTESDKPLISYESVISLITDRTKAIMSVHLNGRRACTKKLKEFVKGKDIIIIDDACQAFMSGSSGNLMGNDADIACYSFGITKTVATGQGGLVITKNKELYDRMKRIKLQGVDSIFECTNYIENGFNFKMTDILASIGIVQLAKIEEKKKKEWEIWNTYIDNLREIKSISFMPRQEDELPWMTEILCDNRDKLRDILEENNISARTIGKGLHEAKFLSAKESYNNSKSIIEKFLYLPSGPNQKIENVQQVVDVIKKNIDRII